MGFVNSFGMFTQLGLQGLTIAEVAAIIGIMIALCYYVPYFYLLAWATEIACVINIVSSDDTPDYKIPWLLFVLAGAALLLFAAGLVYSVAVSRRKWVRE